MGYCTDFIMSFDTNVVNEQEVYDYIKEISDEVFETDWLYSKWYGHENDMKKVSLKFPDILFTLEGQGESNADLWFKYFKNGKMQACYAEIVYPEFNEHLME